MNSGVVPHTAACFGLILTDYLEHGWEKKYQKKSSQLFPCCSYGFMHTFCFVLGLRNARHSFGDLSSTDDWWDWTLSTLLDGLHPEGPSVGARGAQVGIHFLSVRNRMAVRGTARQLHGAMAGKEIC